MAKLIAAWAVAIVATASLAACGDDDDPNRGLPQGSERVTLDPADFTTKIDNPYFPMPVGTRWEYRETDTTRDLVPTEPRAQELKFYVPGIGPVLSIHTDGAGVRAELVAFKRGR